ncbi:c-type cytochrome, partial [Klebsiella variicola]|uniref:c-type cytochrome n=1 Tax=Klebsiella variicola TaxID=244366 RepID=UPI003F666CF9
MAQDLWKGNASKTGAALYVDNCDACHHTDGAGYKPAFPWGWGLFAAARRPTDPSPGGRPYSNTHLRAHPPHPASVR